MRCTTNNSFGEVSISRAIIIIERVTERHFKNYLVFGNIALNKQWEIDGRLGLWVNCAISKALYK